MIKNKIKIAPSLLAADFACLRDEVKSVEAASDLLHLDVMDGRFVPNITVGPVIVRAVRRISRLPLDAHLMIEEPWNYIRDFAEAGADQIIVHCEGYADGKDLLKTIDLIKREGKRCGISLKPKTSVDAIQGLLGRIDSVLLMTVDPGFGGQTFMKEVLPKIKQLRALFDGDIAVDGGINSETSKLAVQSGANVLVAGTAIFSRPDRKKAIEDLRC